MSTKIRQAAENDLSTLKTLSSIAGKELTAQEQQAFLENRIAHDERWAARDRRFATIGAVVGGLAGVALTVGIAVAVKNDPTIPQLSTLRLITTGMITSSMCAAFGAFIAPQWF